MRALALPRYHPTVLYGRRGKQLRCLARDQLVRATPEERVRQRVLSWLIREKRLAKGQLKLEDSLSYADRTRGRPDIMVCDEDGRCQLIVEVKRADHVAGHDAQKQARRYALPLEVNEVWVTNGERHSFARRSRSGEWSEVKRSKVLAADNLGQLRPERIPRPGHRRAVEAYLKRNRRFRGLRGDTLACFLALQALVQQPRGFFKLPYHFRGLHLLSDRDMSPLTFPTPMGWHTSDYRIFLVATEGRVETAAIGVNPWGARRAILSIGFLKGNRKHHALQLQLDGCERREDGGFDVYHHGVIGGRTIGADVTFAAIRDHGREDLLCNDSDGRPRVYLGCLPSPSRMTWQTSRALLSNLLHYAVIRTNLREARPYRAGDTG
jgi:hypothetical protein